MTKEERREPFGNVLSALLARIVDFLRFAEAKNAALLTFSSAWTFALINMLNGDRAPEGIVGLALRFALVLFAAAGVVAIFSFVPKLKLSALHRDPTQPKNLLYFGDIAQFDTAVFQLRIQERYFADGDQSVTNQYLDDLIVQISANSKITQGKYVAFGLGAALVLIAMAALALAVASSVINHATAGALLWA